MLGTILAVIGIILTIMFGIYSIWIYQKNKKTISLELQNNECYSLFDDNINRLNIQLLYNEQPLSNVIILLKARLINNGKIDIDNNRIYSPLKILCKEKFKWLEINTTTQSNGTSASIKQNSDNEVEINWNLLKKDEFIEFEALIEVVDNEDMQDDKAIQFYNELAFDFRITDLDSVQKEHQKSNYEKRFQTRKIYNRMVYIIASFGIPLGIFILSSSFYPDFVFLKNKENINYLVADDNTSYTWRIEPNSRNRINIIEIKTDNVIESSLNEFNKKYNIIKIDSITHSKKQDIPDRVFSLILIFLNLLLLFQNYKRNKKYNKTLERNSLP